MKTRLAGLSVLLFASILIGGCGGDDGNNGTLTIGIADAKPSLPVDAQHVYVTFDEVRVHKAGGDWESLPLPATPYEIDLLAFSDGASTHLVPPVELEAGKYTQIRFGVTGGRIEYAGGQDIELTVPSQFLKTDKNFDFDVEGGSAVDLTVHFDLSQSIVAQGGGEYHLKPVLHLQETQAAAKIEGGIAASSFGGLTEAVVTVEFQSEEYTRIVVQKPESTDPVPFTIFWLVPNQSYHVEVAVEGFVPYEEDVGAEDLGPGGTFSLNGDEPIALSPLP
jgi:hypothetical protein